MAKYITAFLAGAVFASSWWQLWVFTVNNNANVFFPVITTLIIVVAFGHWIYDNWNKP